MCVILDVCRHCGAQGERQRGKLRERFLKEVMLKLSVKRGVGITHVENGWEWQEAVWAVRTE